MLLQGAAIMAYGLRQYILILEVSQVQF